MAEEFAEETTVPASGVGARLRAAREARGLTLAQVAAETRIPQRHLQTIESGDFAALPARTYAVGFSRTYAKVVGLDEAEVAETVRAELDALEPHDRSRPATFEPGDPARVPSRGLFWVVVVAAVLLLLGGYFFMRTLFAPAGELPSLVQQEEAERAAEQAARQAAADSPAPAATGPVVFTALEEGIWVRFYDSDGMRLMEKQMARGESYTVPAEAQGPQLWTGRPDALAITVGGRQVPRLAQDDTVMRDVPVTAEALLARPPAPAATGTAPAAAPAAPAAAPAPSPTA